MSKFEIGEIVSFSYFGNLIYGEIINKTSLFYKIKITESQLEYIHVGSICDFSYAMVESKGKPSDFIFFKDSEFIIKKDEIKSLGIIYGSKQIDIKTGLEKPNFYKIVVNNGIFIDYFEHKEDAQKKLKEISNLLNCDEI